MCPAGYYCPKGTTTAPVCGDASLYCPEGSTVPTTADPGYYTAGGTSVSTRTHQIECQFGHYCIDGIKTACPAGRYGQTRRISSETCTGPCPAGYVCPAGSVALGADDKITDCGSSAVYCPSGSGSPVLVSTGYYTSGGDSPTRHITQTECEPGCVALVVVVCCMQVTERLTPPRMCPPRHYCVAGEKFPCGSGVYGATAGLSTSSCTGPCAAGRFGTTPGQTDDQCEGPCEAGHWCPEGSASSTQEACPAGRYSMAGATTESWYVLTRTDCVPHGVGVPANVPRWLFSTSLCPRGFYCQVATSEVAVKECGSAQFFCPEGSSAPRGATRGYYTAPLEEPEDQRYGQAQCQAGSYCLSGESILCPQGRYGSEPGLSSSDCSGPCAAGRYGNETGHTTATCTWGVAATLQC